MIFWLCSRVNGRLGKWLLQPGFFGPSENAPRTCTVVGGGDRAERRISCRTVMRGVDGLSHALHIGSARPFFQLSYL